MASRQNMSLDTAKRPLGKWLFSTFFGMCLLLHIFLGSGCARTVTSKTPLLSLLLTLEFHGVIDPSKYSYYIMFSGSTGITLPSIPPNTVYFPTPGRTFDDANTALPSNGITDLYSQFFSTWSDYLIVSQESGVNTVQLYKSGAAAFPSSATTTSNLSFQPDINFTVNHNLASPTTIIQIEFSLQQLSISPSSLFFKFAVSELFDGTQAGTLKDILQLTDPSITVKAGETEGPETDDEDLTIPRAMDLKSWQVEIN